MATKSSIEWTELTWNPTVGCTKISPGCKNCYAETMARRLQAMGMAKYAGTTRKSGKRHDGCLQQRETSSELVEAAGGKVQHIRTIAADHRKSLLASSGWPRRDSL